MKQVIVAGAFLLANVIGPAMADCSLYGGNMSAAQINTLLNTAGTTPPGTMYACYRKGAVRENNEYLVGGNQVWDYKKGPAAPGNKDPSKQVGTYIVAGERIAYTYTVGGSFAYNICVTPSGNTYQFVPNPGGANLSIVVSTSNNGC